MTNSNPWRIVADPPTFTAWRPPPYFDYAPLLGTDYLKRRASWIRDELDPMIARDGPDVLRPDDVTALFKFLEQLSSSQLQLGSVCDSRIHFALLEIASCATRWPTSLIDKAEEIIQAWESKWGPLKEIRANVYGPGGRLNGVCTPEDLHKDTLLYKWVHHETSRTTPGFAKRHGDLGFKAGDWWINAMFAYHDGIIDSGESKGGVTACSQCAYALVLTRNDEIESADPERFTYRTRPQDAGRYRLTAGTMTSRQPVRVLRSHTLRSVCSPRAGIRYDGLYKVTGWCITRDPKTGAMQYNINFARLPSEPPIEEALSHPSAEELDDYREYKRIRKHMRENRNPLRLARPFDRLSGTAEATSKESTATVKRPQHQNKRKSSSLQPPAEIIESPPAISSPDENPFFSGALDVTGVKKISELRPDVINYAPVLNAASAAGASIDPFFAGALEEQAQRRISALHPESETVAPVPLIKVSSRDVGSRPRTASSGEIDPFTLGSADKQPGAGITQPGTSIALDLAGRASVLRRKCKA